MSKVYNKVGVLKRAVETQFGKTSGHVQIPIHISKMVLSTVNLGPPDLTKSRTFSIRFVLDF